ncbi:MAG: histidinol-phosphate transaminase [Syntrophales bacterium]|nr:histidinol-phosphate transaminase [Syntrophales bacterium]
MKLEKWIRKEILEQHAYKVDQQDCPVKIDAMENPYVLPPALRSVLAHRLQSLLLNRYPEAGTCRLRSRYAGYFGVGEDMIMIGNGSDELISILCRAFATRGSSVLIPIPSFAIYRIAALNSGQRVLHVPLQEDFDLDLPALLDVIEKEQPALIFLSYPNNPTGNCFDRDKIETIIKNSPGVVVVDEAYLPFSGKTMVSLLKTCENLVILRTLSKMGLAAIRVGFLMGAPNILNELDKIRLPYNVNALSQVAAAFFLDHEPIFQSQIREIVDARDALFTELNRTKGLHPRISHANFIFFSCDSDADRVYGYLLKKGILIKNLNSPGRLKNCMRVTIGTPEENALFVKALKECLST